MAPPMAVSFLTLITILPLLNRNSATTVNEHNHPNGVKSLHFSLYLHETFNRTGYFVVKGVAGPNEITKTSNPFGSVFAYHDPLTATPDPNSKVMGTAEGSAVTTSFDGQRTTCTSRLTLNLKGYKGTVMNVGTADYLRQSELPMVGGTGDFRYVQGYLTTSVVNLSGHTTCYKLDFDLYWPPYAALFNKAF